MVATTKPANVNLGNAVNDPNAATRAMIESLPPGDPIRVQLEGLLASNDKLREENKAKKFGGGNFGLKVGEKGGVSAYGLGRFPVSLYQEQWTKLIGTGVDGDEGHIKEIREFIVAEMAKGTLKVDPESVKASKEAAAARTKEALAKLPPKKK